MMMMMMMISTAIAIMSQSAYQFDKTAVNKCKMLFM
jgi:hypothetical protein